MTLTRRGFLAAGGVAAASEFFASGCRMFTGVAGDFDEELSVFLADPHVCADPQYKDWLFTQGEFDRRIAEILAMRPLPRNVVVFGDLCFDHGDIRDYRLARKQIDLLVASGITVTIGMGNHDRRNTFLEVFPEYAKSSPVSGRIVSVVSLGGSDLVLLDSLKGEDGSARGPTDGGLDVDQQEWIASYLPRCSRPTFVAAHHPAKELKIRGRKIAAVLQESRAVVGWLNGHEHYWMKEPVVSYPWEAGNQDTIRGLYLPSAGLWGDIGYVEFHSMATEAWAQLVQKDYWFHSPLRKGEKMPETWTTIVGENDGQVCRFPYERMCRKV